MSDAAGGGPGASSDQGVPTCYRHTGREAYVRCQRCGRTICADCMNQASVGFQCPDCVAEGMRETRQARTAYGGRRPTTSTARVTLSLIAVNLAVFVLVLATGGGNGWLLPRLALIPVGAVYLVDGQPTVVAGVSDGHAWQLVTSMFTHAEIWHIGFNMLALYILGPQLEMVLGRSRFLALYLLSGLVGSATVYWLAAPFTLTIGASGAVFGLMAALLVVANKVGANINGLLTLVAINVGITVLGASFISWQGHLGGFVGGLLIAAILVYSPRRQRTLWQVLGMSLIATGVVVAVVARTMVLA